MAKGHLSWILGALAAFACALPHVEIDPSLGTAGSAGSAGSGGSGGLGKGGSAGTDVLAGRAGTGNTAGAGVDDPREAACLQYCSIYLAACGDHPANMYADALDCVGVCSVSDWPFGPDLTEVNSLQCRLAHAQFARDLSPDPHCFHSAKVPSGNSCAPQAD